MLLSHAGSLFEGGGTMGIKTTVAHIAVVGGSLYDQPNNILVDERTAPFWSSRVQGPSTMPSPSRCSRSCAEPTTAKRAA